MAYEVFSRTSVRVEEPSVSITLDRRIVLNSAAARIFTKAGVRTVLLLWDQTNRKLAIKATHREDKNGYAVSLPHNGHSGSIRAKSFLNYIGWSAQQRENLSATWDESEKMLEATLLAKHLGLQKAKT